MNSGLFGGCSALITCVQSGLIKVWHEDPAEDVSIMGCQLGGGVTPYNPTPPDCPPRCRCLLRGGRGAAPIAPRPIDGVEGRKEGGGSLHTPHSHLYFAPTPKWTPHADPPPLSLFAPPPPDGGVCGGGAAADAPGPQQTPLRRDGGERKRPQSLGSGAAWGGAHFPHQKCPFATPPPPNAPPSLNPPPPWGPIP